MNDGMNADGSQNPEASHPVYAFNHMCVALTKNVQIWPHKTPLPLV